MKSRGSLITFIGLMIMALAAGFYMIAPYLQALIIGGILTQIITPVYHFLRQRRIGPRMAAFTSTLFMIVLVVGPFLLLTTIAVRQAMEIGHWVLGLEHISMHDLMEKISQWGPLRYFSIDPTELDTHLRDLLQYVGSVGSSFALGLARSVPQGVLQLVLACMTCYCLLTEGQKFSAWISSKLPIAPHIRRGITTAFKDTAISVVLASMAAAGAQSLIMMSAFLILQVPSAFLAGGATFIFAWIPLFGSTPIWLVGAGYLYMNGSITKALIMIVFGIITGTIDNFIRPLVLKGRGEMHPLVSLVAIFGGLQWFGFFGVFLGPILVAVVITLLQLWPMVGRPYGLVFANDPEDLPATDGKS